MYIQGNPKIVIVQGDSYTREIEFEGVTLDFIENVYFTSNKLSLCKTLFKDTENNVFILVIKHEESKNFPIGTFDFDLTVKFMNDNIKTIQYRSIISILEKNNVVICNE